MTVRVGDQVQHLNKKVDLGQRTGKGIEVEADQAIPQRVQNGLNPFGRYFRMAFGARLFTIGFDSPAGGLHQKGAGATGRIQQTRLNSRRPGPTDAVKNERHDAGRRVVHALFMLMALIHKAAVNSADNVAVHRRKVEARQSVQNANDSDAVRHIPIENTMVIKEMGVGRLGVLVGNLQQAGGAPAAGETEIVRLNLPKPEGRTAIGENARCQPLVLQHPDHEHANDNQIGSLGKILVTGLFGVGAWQE